MEIAPRYATRRDRRRNTFGPEVADEARFLGWDPMAYQVELWDAMFEYQKAPGVGLGFTFVRDQACCTLPRQNGKSVSLLAAVSWMCRKWPDMRVGWVAGDRRTSVELIEGLADRLLERSVDVKFLMTAGRESIEFRDTGSRLEVLSSTERAGHGRSWDMVVGDETWRLGYTTLQSIVPAQAARPSSILVMISTQGTEESSVLNDYVKRGREGDTSLTYMEWSAPDGVDVFDQDLWPMWMPALTQSKFLTLKKVVSGARSFASEPQQFIRAYGNRLVRSDASLYTPDLIESARREPEPAPAKVVFGVDVSFGDGPAQTRRTAGVVVAGWVLEDGTAASAVMDYRLGEDTSWVAQVLREEIRNRPQSTVVIGAGPSITIAAELEALCVDVGATFVSQSTTNVAAAAMRFDEWAKGEQLAVTDDTGEFERGMLSARAVKVGRTGAWQFDRSVLMDQSVLIAMSLALDQAWVEGFEPKPFYY